MRENLWTTPAVTFAGRLLLARPGRITAARTKRPPPQREAAMRWSQSIISATLKSPASEACPDALLVMATMARSPSMKNMNARDSGCRLPALSAIDRTKSAAIRMSQICPRWVRKRTVGSTEKAFERGRPLISAARTSRSLMLLAIVAARAMPSSHHIRASRAADESSRTQRRQTRTPMEKFRKTSSSHSGAMWMHAVIVSIPTFAASLDHKGIFPVGPVPVPRHNAPDYAVGAWREPGHAYLKELRIGRVHPSVPVVHHFSVRTMDHDRGKDRFQGAVEPDAHTVGRNRQRGAHLRVGMVRKRMSPRRFRHGAETYEGKECAHRPEPHSVQGLDHRKIGPPMPLGKRSSMKR